VAVAIKQVPPGLEGGTDPKNGFVLRAGPGRLNPNDGPAIELALRLKDSHGAMVDLFSMGPPQAERTLKEAMSLGADRAFLVTDPLLAGSDSLATSRALVAAMELEGPYGLVVCGLATTDGGTGQVGPEMAALMGRAFAGRVSEAISLKGQELTVRQIYQNEILVARLALPAVITVLRESLTPRLPSVKARLWPRLVTRITLGDLADDRPNAALLFGERGSPTKILRAHKPKAPERVLARLTPAMAASTIIDMARKAKP
jgi:electron transfer flavoprotein beta subunit